MAAVNWSGLVMAILGPGDRWNGRQTDYVIGHQAGASAPGPPLRRHQTVPCREVSEEQEEGDAR